MAAISRAGVWRGVAASPPAMLAAGPFGMIFGVLAGEAGLDFAQAMAMTTIVVAGASQVAAVQLMNEQAPVLVVILTGAAVNLRMAMYSAAIAPHWRGAPLWTRALAAYALHDQAFALSTLRYARHPEEPLADKVGYFFGVGFCTIVVWIAASYVGYALGTRVPPEWSLDFAVPVTFLAILAPLLRSLPHVVAAATAAAGALALMWLPFNFGMIIGACLGVAAGALTDLRLARGRGASALEKTAEGAE